MNFKGLANDIDLSMLPRDFKGVMTANFGMSGSSRSPQGKLEMLLKDFQTLSSPKMSFSLKGNIVQAGQEHRANLKLDMLDKDKYGVKEAGFSLQILYGKDHKLVYDGLFPIYGSGGIMRYGNEYLYEGESVLIPRKGTLNNIILADGKFWCIDTMFYSIPKIPKICKLAFFQLKAFDMEVFNSGTALPSMTIKILSCLKLLVPDEKYRTLFEQSISAIFNELTYLKKLNVTLQQMRDRLLPQLMSGQLEVTP